jgi:multiple sugar transport system ATP-binding protein
MNLLPVQVAAPGQLLVAGQRLLLEGALQDLSAAHLGESFTGGLRPEHLRLAPATNRNLAAEVCHLEALGNEQLLTCRLREGAQLLQVRTGPDQRVVVGQGVHLEVDPAGWRLFDGSGNALQPPREPREPGEPQLPLLG